jgi:fructosamine-3-kinase
LLSTKITNLKTAFLNYLQSELNQIKDKPVQVTNCSQVFGGDINTTYVLFTEEDKYFIKLNVIAFDDMLQKEKEGLLLLRSANTLLKIPEPILQGTFEQQSFLLIEYLEKGTESKILWQQLATGLAQLHQTTQDHFGLHYNNYIGTVFQNNTTTTTWAQFYALQRILPLMRQAYEQQKCTKADLQLAEQFCSKLSALMPEEPAALLHGDLWSGNRMFTLNGKACIYDPAVYFGHREMDIAMTLLFGGFDTQFYTTYNEVFPLQNGWRERIDICQLYPLLVHLILFGGHYYGAVKSILKIYG